MPFPVTTVLLVGALGAAVLGAVTSFAILVCVALVLEIVLFLIAGFGE